MLLIKLKSASLLHDLSVLFVLDAGLENVAQTVTGNASKYTPLFFWTPV